MTRRPLPLLLVALLLLSSLAPLASAGEAWTKETGSAITAVATDERGDLIFVGTESGMVYCYNSAGSVVWSVQLGTAGADPSILDIRADTEGHIWVRLGNDVYLLNAETGANIWYLGKHDVSAMGGGLSNTGIALNVWDNVFDLKILSGDYIYVGGGSYNNGAISGDGTWAVVTKPADTNLYLYSVNLPPDDWIAPYASHGWNQRIAHTIAGSTDGALTNYPVEITVIRGTGTSSGSTVYLPDCRADFADIRFTAADGVTQIPYYLESVNGNTATFWVNVPSIPASPATTTIYVYWSYPSTIATTSDPDAQWIFYDDFEDGSINTSLWTVTTGGAGTVTETGGYLNIYSPYAAADYATVTGPTVSYPSPSQIIANISFHDVAGNDRNRLPVIAGADIGVFYDSGAYKLFWDGYTATTTTLATPQLLHAWWTPGGSATYTYGSDWNVTRSPGKSSVPIVFRAGEDGGTSTSGHMRIYDIGVTSYNSATLFPRSWGPVESIVTPLDTKTLDGTIIDIDAPETGDWVAVSTTTKTYIVEITDSGFGTVYSADRTGTPYAVAIANNAAALIEGRGILADIFRFDGVQTGTYTAGGPVRTVAIAQKNGLYAAAGSDDGKYYIFSKDESSSWYLLHSSDSENPVTAIAMSWRGEIAVIGRADGSVVLYTTDAPPPDSQMTVYAIKDGKPYIGKTVSVSTADVSDPDDEWTPLYTSLRTDSEGKIVISTHTGHYYQININNGEKIVVIQASSATPIHSVVFRSPLIYEKYSYDVQYNASSQAIEMTYTDNEGPATVTWSIVRTDTYSEVYSHTTSGVTAATATYPISEPDISYKVNVKIQRSSGESIQNMWFVTPQNASPIALPFWDENIQNAVFIIFLMILGGVFYYSTGAKGALIVALVAALFRYFSWITVPWFWIIAAAVFAFLANIAEGA